MNYLLLTEEQFINLKGFTRAKFFTNNESYELMQDLHNNNIRHNEYYYYNNNIRYVVILDNATLSILNAQEIEYYDNYPRNTHNFLNTIDTTNLIMDINEYEKIFNHTVNDENIEFLKIFYIYYLLNDNKKGAEFIAINYEIFKLVNHKSNFIEDNYKFTDLIFDECNIPINNNNLCLIITKFKHVKFLLEPQNYLKIFYMTDYASDARLNFLLSNVILYLESAAMSDLEVLQKCVSLRINANIKLSDNYDEFLKEPENYELLTFLKTHFSDKLEQFNLSDDEN